MVLHARASYSVFEKSLRDIFGVAHFLNDLKSRYAPAPHLFLDISRQNDERPQKRKHGANGAAWHLDRDGDISRIGPTLFAEPGSQACRTLVGPAFVDYI